MSTAVVEAVVFDIGNVLIEWDPRRLYRKLLADKRDVDAFLANVCTQEWNREQDRGRPFAEGIAVLQRRHPEQADLIAAYWNRWPEMLGGAMSGTVDILDDLQGADVPCYGLTNFSNETWPLALRRFPFLLRLEGIIVSGRERVIKPERAIFRRLQSRFDLTPARTVFIDDMPANVSGAAAMDFQAVRFESADKLRTDLRTFSLPV